MQDSERSSGEIFAFSNLGGSFKVRANNCIAFFSLHGLVHSVCFLEILLWSRRMCMTRAEAPVMMMRDQTRIIPWEEEG